MYSGGRYRSDILRDAAVGCNARASVAVDLQNFTR